MKTLTIIYILVMVAVIVAVDVLFLRRNIVARLLVNIGVVIVFLAVYFLLFRR